MLEVQEERAAHFSKKERAKKEREEPKDGRPASSSSSSGSSSSSTGLRSSRSGQAHAKATPTPSPHQHLTPPTAASLGSPSMHSSNPKVRNSPSANTQSSPKSKQEAMVRSPPVMSPSSAAQMDSKLPNQGKQGGTGGQSQPSPCDPKALSGSHAPKGPQGTTGNLGLKNGQGLNSGSGAKGKVKRERSTSVESFEQRDTGTPSNEPDQKDAGSRAKRMCVAERRQPYSGADWCSGGESDEDDPRFFNCNSSDVKSQDSNSLPPSSAGISRSSTPSHNAVGGQSTVSDPASSQKAPSKIVYVFTTEMANKAAEAVITGHADTIIAYHMKNISNSKGDKPHLPVNNQVGPLRNEPKPLQQGAAPPQQQSSHPSEQNHQAASKAAPLGQQQPAPTQQPPPGAKPGGLPDGAPGGMDSKSLPSGSPRNATPQDGGNPAGTPGAPPPCAPGAQPGFPLLEPSKGGDPKMTAQHHQQLANEIMSSMGDNPEGLSQEQLEHRERSLQTLRDIQRMLFPDEKDFSLKDVAAMGQGNPGAPPPNQGMMEGMPKKPDQGPLQAMMAQSQSLGKPGPGPRPDGPPFGQPGHRDMPFSPDELGPPPPGPPMNSHQGPEQGDHMTPEQMAWLKLQQEFYEEKKRKQEQMQHRPLPDMMLHQHGPRGMMRGPPPPYQMNPGEVWGPGGPEPFPEQMNMGPRGMHPPHPMQRMPGFPGMMNPDMDTGPNPMARPGMNWPDDMPKMGDGRGFPPGQGVFGGPGGRVERFPNPQSVQEAMFQQGMGDKQQMGLPPGMVMDMNRMMGNQRPMDPGSNNGGGGMFPRMPGDGPMSPSSRMEFVKGLGRDMGEFGMGPGNMNNMGPNPQMMPSKIREPPMNLSPEEMMKMRQGGGGGGPPPENMGPQQKMMQGPPFPDQPQSGDFNMGPNRHFPGMPQGPGNMRGPRGEGPFGPEQRTNMGSNARLSHLPPLPPNQPPNPANLSSGPPPNQRNLGRKPSDLSVQAGPVSSPSVNSLKSPTLRQSPMLGSPSGNLKSPQTPSQLAGMLTGASAAAAAAAAAAASIKSPPMMGSAGASPVHLKSPSLPAPSPGWTSSPKPPMQSPGIPQSNKPSLSMTSPSMMGNVEPGGNGPPSAPPPSNSSGQPGNMNLPGSLPSGSPYNLPPEPTLSQNPLSIMMSRMSKFAMPSSTPLYHDAIKTVASSDDDSPPARSPNLPPMNNNMPGMGVNHHPGHPRMMVPNSSGHMPSLSPMGMNTMGSQPLSHGMPNQMPSPNPMGPNMPPHSGGPMGPGMMSHGMMMPPVSQDPGMGNSQMIPQRMGFPHRQQGFPPGQSPPQQVPFPHNGPGPQGGFPHGMGFPGEGGPMGRLGNMPHGPGGEPGMCKPNAPGGQESFNNMPNVFNDADLHEVIRPGASGIPEFDLSRIIPSEKPSQTLSYFPRGEASGGKPPHPSGPPGFPQMQGMMVEGNPRMGLPMPGMGGPPGPGHMGPQDMPMGNPGHNAMRPPGFMPQGMMGPQHRMLSPGQPGMSGQPGMMGGAGMMQGKERGPLYNHPGPVGSPNMMMSLHGMGGPQQTMMMPPQMRPRGMAADVGMGFNSGPGNPGNLMF
ncbi:LOW QUALITY PROTEIN: B-cell CLL/lymphoma 9 protein-like [Megalops cyprinoides]|uniref:LOW QUALITY PROTEIN: B-cell CLL/lymphoma 9 protein-like n=1 Tax=Megalops cyprinoides TaxID=118141 RepID=UPI0018641D34|nr:LOW QUALITY PROTEIN: B-cell CLL/lymphoma 9 protein-like [Megalops cyprinoides]